LGWSRSGECLSLPVRTYKMPLTKDGYKNFSASHGMTHGSFKDYLSTHGEAKTAEEKATERAVHRARAQAAAKQKVSAMQKKDPKLQGSKLQAELDAQAKRAEAQAYVQRNACGPSQYELTGRTYEKTGGDNTLKVVAQRRAKEQAAEQKRMQLLKQNLIEQQKIVGAKVAEIATGGGGSASSGCAEALAPIPSWWKEVPDPTSGQTYYWNSITNQTSWDRPPPAEGQGQGQGAGQPASAAVAAASSSSSSSTGGTPASDGLGGSWGAVDNGAGIAAAKEEEEVLPAGWSKVCSRAKPDVGMYGLSQQTRHSKPNSQIEFNQINTKQKKVPPLKTQIASGFTREPSILLTCLMLPLHA